LQLRNGQSSCTDNECTDLVRPQNGSTASDDGVDNFTFLIFMLIAAVILYLIRPNSLRQRSAGDTNKHSRDNVRKLIDVDFQTIIYFCFFFLGSQ